MNKLKNKSFNLIVIGTKDFNINNQDLKIKKLVKIQFVKGHEDQMPN